MANKIMKLRKPGVFSSDAGTYTDSYETVLGGLHPQTMGCSLYGCVIHSPSHHNMVEWPTLWRADRRIFERICPHGVGHPDPDDMEFIRRSCGRGRAYAESIHGCDGCCSKPSHPGP